MQLISTSEYELGFLAFGGAPVGIIAIGAAPIGVIAVGIAPMGLLSFACGIGLGIFNFTCGVGLGAYVRAVGLGLGADCEAVGLGIPLGGSERSPWYWTCMALMASLVSVPLYHFGRERIAVTKMKRVAYVTWKARPAKSEGIFVAPDTECEIRGQLRSDGTERLHVRLTVVCGSLKLADRRISHGCGIEQHTVEGGHAYRLQCTANRVAASENDDRVTPEAPGLRLDTLESPGRARIHANGPPPMNIELEVDTLSDVVEIEPLLMKGGRVEATEPGVLAGTMR